MALLFTIPTSSFPSTLHSKTKFPSLSPIKFNSLSTTIVSCSKETESSSNSDSDSNSDNNQRRRRRRSRKLSEQSSWEAKDAEGRDYLYRLGKEAENMNIAVGARAGVIDDVFAGNFLGKDSDIVFDYRHKVTRSFEYLQGDYYIAPLFMV